MTYKITIVTEGKEATMKKLLRVKGMKRALKSASRKYHRWGYENKPACTYTITN